MNTSLLELTYFALPLFIMGLIVKYGFKLDMSILLPSVIMFFFYVLITICASLTSKKFETELFTIFWILQLIAIVGSIFLMSKQEILWKHFFVSLPFQLFYWILLFYYGGLQFTHKFEV